MNCRVRLDPDGILAVSLGNLTSGAVTLYDPMGILRYQGGITASRGHEGDNPGEEAVLQVLRGGQISHKSMPAFGCPIKMEVINR
jgi:hypothetical protein